MAADDSEGDNGSLEFFNADTGDVLGTYTTKRMEAPQTVSVDVTGVDKIQLASPDPFIKLYNATLTPIAKQ